MKKRKKLTLSVHQLVDFLLRSGSIDSRVFNATTMNEGSRLHAYYQSKQGDNYLAEYFLKHTFLIEDYEVTIQGRADGIIEEKNRYLIDEIKTTLSPLDEFEKEHLHWHLGQAKCYAFMFMDERKLSDMGIKLTYIRQGKKEKKIELFFVTYEEAKNYVHGLIENYLLFHSIIERKRVIRDDSLKDLSFPFPTFRNGQRKLAKYAYSIATKGGKLFVQAPTGIGKSMSTIFPFVKSLKDNENGKIFYLTAKGSGKEACNNALDILRNKGAKFTNITILAKDKICPRDEKRCNPDECPLARNYYSKIKDIIKETLIYNDNLTTDLILTKAMEKEICPFEFQLDLSLYSDIIVCDYNYLFDPTAYMRRYFDEDASSHLVLVDEAHNLVDRSKDMYSASISLKQIKDAKKKMKDVESPRLKRALSKVQKAVKEYEIYKDVINYKVDGFYELDKPFTSFVNAYTDTSKDKNTRLPKEIIELFLDINRFIKMGDFNGDNYLNYVGFANKNITLNIKCLDSSKFLRRCSSLVKGNIFFSATLTPENYFINLLGGKEDDPFLSLNSPFDNKNLSLMIAPMVSVKYKNRKDSYKTVASYIEALMSKKKGNYIVYTPSYEYLNEIVPYLSKIDASLLVQTKDMSDKEKDEFISAFDISNKESVLGVCVLGGAFSEGIDLKDDRLIGVIVIGVGMPKLCFELDKTSEYYDSIGYKGKDYAYINPGMNKVAQAAGRVIRSETDRGVVLLIDERYTLATYNDLFRKEWSTYKVVFNENDVKEIVDNFFE